MIGHQQEQARPTAEEGRPALDASVGAEQATERTEPTDGEETDLPS